MMSLLTQSIFVPPMNYAHLDVPALRCWSSELGSIASATTRVIGAAVGDDTAK